MFAPILVLGLLQAHLVSRGIQTMKRVRELESKRKAGEVVKQKPPKPTELIQPRQVHIIRGAFNSTPTFRDPFLTTALAGLSAEVHQGVQYLKQIGCQLEGLADELSAHTIATVQGWQNTDYGAFLYKYLETEMNTHAANHYFYLFHPDTTWYPVFNERVRENPLSERFGGYSCDLEAIFLWMGLNRRSLVSQGQDREESVFHLLVSAYYPYAINMAYVISEDVGPLVVEGQLHRGKELAWFKFVKVPEDVSLRHVGDLNTVEESGGSRLPVASLGVIVSSVARIMSYPMGAFATASTLSGVCGLFAGAVKALCGSGNVKHPRVLGRAPVVDDGDDSDCD
jgi:hypothetical protein